MKKRVNKYIYYWTIRADYGYGNGFETIDFFDKKDSSYGYVKRMMAEYRLSCPSASYKTGQTRELNADYQPTNN